MKIKAVIIVLVVLVLVFVLLWQVFQSKKRITIKLPSGEVVEAVKAPRMSQEERERILAATIEGKIEELSISAIPGDTSSSIVIITNQGELVMLFNPEFVNKLRFGKYVGKNLKLDGYWYGQIPLKGKSYRSLWIKQISETSKK